LEAIANLKDMLAYCHVWGRMTFDIGEEDEAREVSSRPWIRRR
jgi:hypothetical protein